MTKFTEDDCGTMVRRGNRTYQVDCWGKLVPVATSKSNAARRNRMRELGPPPS